ncbi:hypothetical protein [Mesorhizobium sp. M0802]|uniref:hypothetical protein n=1 Tax=Mesorhizobium sp. M0802 TaxID=2957001 RepID=UPI00333B6744
MSGNTRPFTMVAPGLHSSRRYLSLDDSGRALFHYVLTGPHQTSCGCSQIKPGYAAADLGSWDAAKFVRYRAALLDAELIAFDADTDEIYIERWFKHHAKGSWKYAKSIKGQISKIESDPIREKAEEDFMATPMGEAAVEADGAERTSERPSPANAGSRLLNSRIMQGGR